jgi:hypothetical protein
MDQNSNDSGGPDLTLSVSEMTWRMVVEVYRSSDSQLRLVLSECNPPMDDDTEFEWEISDGPFDMVSQVGLALCLTSAPMEQISGIA